MNPRTAAAAFALLTCCYIGIFALLETRRHLQGLGQFLGALPVLLSLTAVGWVARFLRWQWLLRRAGCRVPAGPALLAYLSGFAFTATPGKVGELVRMRYFASYGVPHWKVLAAFVYERACDLVVVLLLATLAFHDPRLFALATAFVGGIVAIVLLFALRPAVLTHAQVRSRRAGHRRLARLARFLRNGLAGCRLWLRPADLGISVTLALVAWGTTSLALVYLARSMGLALPVLSGLGIYPLAMLVGAASMLPGGVGTTEAVIVAMLAARGVPWQAAAVVALGARLATLWFAMAAGLLSVGCLEYARARRARAAPA